MLIIPGFTPIPKPQRPKSPAVETFADGREVCANTVAGRREYRKRLTQMWERQEGICRWCADPMPSVEALAGFDSVTFDHDFGRGSGGSRRDDRIEVDGVPQNAAVHWRCNADKASSRFLTRAEAEKSKQERTA